MTFTHLIASQEMSGKRNRLGLTHIVSQADHVMREGKEADLGVCMPACACDE